MPIRPDERPAVLTALTREVSDGFDRCQLTHLDRVPIDVARARAQHDAYEWALVRLGCTVRRLPSTATMPDAVFIEDTAVAVKEGVVIARPGAESRRGEPAAVAEALARLGRPLQEIVEPGTLDGGDVLVVGRRVFVGASARTNAAGIVQLRRMLRPYGYAVEPVVLHGGLHLKSAATTVAPDTLLVNPDWVATETFSGLELIGVDPDEPHGANALLVAGSVIYPSTHPNTRRRLEAHGVRVTAVEVDELAKAEGGVTCCSLIVEM